MKKIGYIITVIVLLLVINGLLQSIFDLWQKQDLLASAKNELQMQKNKNTKLKAELSYVKTQSFVDETARNKLFLVKPGEEDVIIPSNMINSSGKAAVKNTPNWQKWLKLFY